MSAAETVYLPSSLAVMAVDDYLHGMSASRVAARYAVDAASVGRWVKRAGFPVRGVARTTCGTNGGYQAHLLAGQPPCQPCREAHATYGREYRAKRAAA